MLKHSAPGLIALVLAGSQGAWAQHAPVEGYPERSNKAVETTAPRTGSEIETSQDKLPELFTEPQADDKLRSRFSEPFFNLVKAAFHGCPEGAKKKADQPLAMMPQAAVLATNHDEACLFLGHLNTFAALCSETLLDKADVQPILDAAAKDPDTGASALSLFNLDAAKAGAAISSHNAYYFPPATSLSRAYAVGPQTIAGKTYTGVSRVAFTASDVIHSDNPKQGNPGIVFEIDSIKTEDGKLEPISYEPKLVNMTVDIEQAKRQDPSFRAAFDAWFREKAEAEKALARKQAAYRARFKKAYPKFEPGNYDSVHHAVLDAGGNPVKPRVPFSEAPPPSLSFRPAPRPADFPSLRTVDMKLCASPQN